MAYKRRRTWRKKIHCSPKTILIFLLSFTASVAAIPKAIAGPGIAGVVPAKNNGFLWSTSISVVPNGRLDNLLQRMRYRYKHGDLLDLNGHVIKKNGGVSPTLNLGLGRRLFALNSGRDRTEPVRTIVTPLPPPVKESGTGAFFRVDKPGRTGRLEAEKGRYSGIVRKKSEFLPEERLFKRYNPKVGKYVALTFDDGPYPETSKVLDILGKYHIKATFFWIGKHVEKYPQVARLVVKNGHEVGNHTYSHCDLAAATERRFRYQLLANENVIRKATGYKTVLYRPVAGHYSAKSVENAFSMGYEPVLWSEDSRDWKRPGVQAIVRGAMPKHSETAVVLMHDGGGDRTETIEALPYVIESYKKMGYSFVTVSKLLDMEGTGK